MLHGQMLTGQMFPRQLTTHQTNQFWLKLDGYQLRYSIIFRLGQMLHEQMLTVQMSPRKLTTHTDGLIIQPSKSG